MTKREQMLKAVADQKARAQVSIESCPPPEPVAPATPKPPREKHPNDKLRARQRGHVQVAKGRLPDGSRFAATYDAAKERWFGDLVTTVGGEPVLLTADSKGVWRLMERLDDLYREHLKTQETK